MSLPRTYGWFLLSGALLFADATAQNWSLSPQPAVSIGQVEGAPEYLLNGVQHARRLSDGRFLVTMGPDIRYYDARGKYVSKAGGRGRGPGEFQYIQDLHVLPGDTLLALNFRQKVWLTADGKYIRSELMNLEPLAEDGWFSEGAVLLPNGNLLAPQYPREKPNDQRLRELHRPVLRYVIFNLRTGQLQPLIVSGGLRQMRVGAQGNIVQPFTPHARHAIGSDRVYVGDNDTTFLSVFTFDGKPLGRVRVADRPTPVRGRDLDDYRARMLEFLGDDAPRRRGFLQGWALVPKPKRLPYWGTALVDRTGNLWVSDPQRAASAATRWSVFDRSGKRIARVAMPPRFVPKEIGANYVLGVTRDEFDVEYVRLYPLNQGSR